MCSSRSPGSRIQPGLRPRASGAAPLVARTRALRVRARPAATSDRSRFGSIEDSASPQPRVRGDATFSGLFPRTPKSSLWSEDSRGSLMLPSRRPRRRGAQPPKVVRPEAEFDARAGTRRSRVCDSRSRVTQSSTEHVSRRRPNPVPVRRGRDDASWAADCSSSSPASRGSARTTARPGPCRHRPRPTRTAPGTPTRAFRDARAVARSHRRTSRSLRRNDRALSGSGRRPDHSGMPIRRRSAAGSRRLIPRRLIAPLQWEHR